MTVGPDATLRFRPEAGRPSGPSSDREVVTSMPVPDQSGPPSSAPISATERQAWEDGRPVVGIDEVGRGAWAGPLTLAAVRLDPKALPDGVRDSKLLAPARRSAAAHAVYATGQVGLGHVSNHEIDEGGLAHALRQGARRALEALLAHADLPSDPVVMIDGPVDLLRMADVEVVTLVRGDANSITVAAASVVAKVARDEGMVAAGETYPHYGFSQNKGYPSAAHIAALHTHGPCALHRMSWAPLVRLVQPTLPGIA
jgi:ribonuclease HII